MTHQTHSQSKPVPMTSAFSSENEAVFATGDAAPLGRGERLLTAALLIVVPAVFTGAFLLLSARFNYPEILRRPSEEVRRRFDAGAAQILPLWWAMLAAAVLFIPTALLTVRALRLHGGALLLAVVLGAFAGLVQTLGIARWTFLVPTLASRYVHTPESDPTRRTLVLLFDAFHHYVGAGIGEWLGYLFTAGWTLLIAGTLLRRGSRLFGIAGLAFGLGILIGTLQPFGVPGVGAINAIAYLLWSLWMIALGIRLTRSSTQDSFTR